MNLLVTGAWASAKDNIEKLQNLGHKVSFLQQEKDNLPCKYEWVKGIIGNGIFLYHDISKFTNLQYIQLTSAGFDRVPMDYVNEHNIRIFNARGVYSIPMAEFAISEVLSVYKKTHIFIDNQKECKWEKQRDLLELYDKKVCILGCGSVGTECAKRFSAFGCNVYGVDLYPYKNDWYKEMQPLSKLDDMLPNMDIVILTLPLTKDTEGLFNRERLNKMKTGSILVNIARGKIIDEKALVEYSSHLKAIILDVFEKEPLEEDNPLWKVNNVIITPHNSFVGENNNVRLTEVIFKNLRGE